MNSAKSFITFMIICSLFSVIMTFFDAKTRNPEYENPQLMNYSHLICKLLKPFDCITQVKTSPKLRLFICQIKKYRNPMHWISVFLSKRILKMLLSTKQKHLLL